MPQLKPFIQQQFHAPIWKFVIDEKAGLLIAEIRDADNREVSFVSINLHTGAVNFDNLTLHEKWLTGLTGCANGTILLHGYLSAQSPVHKGITAVHAFTGEQLWSDYNNAINFISINGPIVYNTQLQPVKLFLADAQTGATLRPFDASIDIATPVNVEVPDILTNLPAGFTRFFDDEVTGNCHYIEHNSFRIVSLHTLKHGLLQQQLIVVLNNEVIYRDILTDKTQKLQPEAFILHQNQLMYIKNATELIILNL